MINLVINYLFLQYLWRVTIAKVIRKFRTTSSSLCNALREHVSLYRLSRLISVSCSQIVNRCYGKVVHARVEPTTGRS